MSDQLGIPAGSLRCVWVFQVDLPEEEAKAFARVDWDTDADDPPWPLREALGLAYLDEDFIEVFEAQSISDYGFARYLIEANGMDAASVAPDAEKLDGLEGTVVLIFSQALSENAQRLDPRPPLRLIGRYAERADFTPRIPPQTEAAKPNAEAKPEKKRPSDAAMSGRVATVALLVMALLVWLMIWVAG